MRIDPAGLAGPTRHQAAGPRWRQTSSGLYVPSDAPSHLEQRILEQGSRIRAYGAVTAWAALRWRGASFFDGMAFPEDTPLPIPLVTGGHDLQRDVRVAISKAQLAPRERESIGGIWVATADRALFDEMTRHGQLRQAVVDLEMAIAAGLLTLSDFRGYVGRRNAWTGIELARKVALVAGLGCRSPQEVRMALVWMWDAGLERPLCNVPIFDLHGRLIAIVDLLDVEAGCVGEYQGADHKGGERHRSDVAREQALRDHGLECFEVVGGDLQDRGLTAKRMLSARDRARFESPLRRTWTLRKPAWWAGWAAARGL
ncbi:MAG: hypothetical protein LH477_06180 [Nocardioides sp.]|nr:hypothetical protein [Nocardioides sp.]